MPALLFDFGKTCLDFPENALPGPLSDITTPQIFQQSRPDVHFRYPFTVGEKMLDEDISLNLCG